MKPLSLLLLLMLGMPLSAQNVFVVNRVQKAVERLDPESTAWVKAKRNDTLKLFHKVRIPQAGQLVLVESGTGLVYKSGEGEYSVKEIVDREKKRTSSLVRSIFGQLVDDAKQKGSGQGRTVYGATSRGDGDSAASAEAALADSLFAGAYAYLSVEPVPGEGRGMAHLVVNNATTEVIRINIVGLNRKESLAKIILPTDEDGSVCVGPGKTALTFLNIIPSPDIQYRAFPVDGELDYSLLQRLLREKLSE